LQGSAHSHSPSESKIAPRQPRFYSFRFDYYYPNHELIVSVLAERTRWGNFVFLLALLQSELLQTLSSEDGEVSLFLGAVFLPSQTTDSILLSDLSQTKMPQLSPLPQNQVQR
jgi:hypothetical protein